MITKAYKIKCLTNLHVGNGDVNFNIIDNEVERDPVTGYPTINASGVKGALREHFEGVLGKDNSLIKDIFGKTNDGKSEMSQGKVKIFNANMLAIPMRTSKGKSPYSLVTTECALNGLKALVSALKNSEINLVFSDEAVEVEGVECNKIVTVFDEKAAVMAEDSFKSVSLPVLARNCLEPGKENLWYEEIVPHESVMYFFVASSDEKAITAFDETVKNNNIVQFGGNASIGYGVCKLEEVL